MRLSGRRPDVAVRSGERTLAWCASDRGPVAGTRDALYLPVAGPGPVVESRRIPWEQVEAADWDADASRLRVSEVGSWGEVRPRHTLVLDGEPGRLLGLVRERVTASVVLQWRVPVPGRGGVQVIARRAPSGARSVEWLLEYDEGVDPADPEVRRLTSETLARARADVGAQ